MKLARGFWWNPEVRKDFFMEEKQNFYKGGYYIVKPISNDVGSYIPANCLTVSTCISDIYPEKWGWAEIKKEEKKRLIEYLDIDEETFEKLQNHISHLFDLGKFRYPFIFSDVDGASEFYHLFLRNVSGLKLLGVGLAIDYAKEFIEEEGVSGGGVFDNLSEFCEIDNRGNFVGFDILGFDFMNFHTMYCHSSLIDVCNGELKIFFNQRGLIDDYSEAKRIISYIDSGKIGVEPALWQPWAVFEFGFSGNL